MTHEVVLIHEDADLVRHFQKEFANNGTRITPVKSTRAPAKATGNPHPLVVIAAEGDWSRELKILEKLKKERKEFYVIVSSPSMLEKTISQIHTTAIHLGAKNSGEANSFPSNMEASSRGAEPCLAELVEKKLAPFVKKIKNCEVKNLYGLLIREFEKPLITLALKETQGNQIQAAQLLGLNRNTLRKKMKELKISAVKNKTR